MPWSSTAVMRSSRYPVELCFEVSFAAEADDLVSDFAVLENQEGGNGADAVLSGEPLELIDVQLGDLDLAIVFGSEVIQNRRNHFTRAAPFRPKIDENRD